MGKEIDEQLIAAIQRRDTRAAMSALDSGADVNYRLDSGRDAGDTPLIQAALQQLLVIVRRLLEEGANPNIQGRRGLSALVFAAMFNGGGMTQLLLEKGADPDLANDHGRTALHGASFLGRDDSVQVLLHWHADYTKKDIYGQTALDLAIKHKRLGIVRMLEQAGATK